MFMRMHVFLYIHILVYTYNIYMVASTSLWSFRLHTDTFVNLRKQILIKCRAHKKCTTFLSPYCTYVCHANYTRVRACVCVYVCMFNCTRRAMNGNGAILICAHLMKQIGLLVDACMDQRLFCMVDRFQMFYYFV